MRTALAGIVAGIALGVLTSFGQTEVHGAAAAFFNSASAWLVAPLVVGAAVARTRAGAAAAGMATCVLQLVAYDVTASMRGFAVGVAINVFWAVCAVVGGPLFGLAGRLWREGRAHRRGSPPRGVPRRGTMALVVNSQRTSEWRAPRSHQARTGMKNAPTRSDRRGTRTRTATRKPAWIDPSSRSW